MSTTLAELRDTDAVLVSTVAVDDAFWASSELAMTSVINAQYPGYSFALVVGPDDDLPERTLSSMADFNEWVATLPQAGA